MSKTHSIDAIVPTLQMNKLRLEVVTSSKSLNSTLAEPNL